MATNRFQAFLYSNRNIAGCILALCGLALFFTGIVHAYWWAVVLGLYSAGAVAFPTRRNLAQVAEHTELSPDLLARHVHGLVNSVVSGLPKESINYLRSIEHTLGELLPRLKELSDRGVITYKDSFTVTETVRRYLPDTLGAYLRLPKMYANMQPLADGRTAAQTLINQLWVLDNSLKAIARSAFEGDAQALLLNGQFLEQKFSEKLAFRP